MTAARVFKTRAMLRTEDKIGRPLDEFLRERYESATMTEIGAELGVSTAAVARWMREYGIEPRFPGQRPPVTAA